MTPSLRERLAKLTPAQRGRLTEQMAAGGGPAKPPRARFGPIAKAVPLRVEPDPSGGQTLVYPASHGQARMWFLHRYAPDSPVYSTPTAFHLAGPVNPAWIEEAVARIVQRQDALRTTFAMEADGLVQRVAPFKGFTLEVIPVEGEAAPALNGAAWAPFDLAAAPPFRVRLFRLGPAEHVLLVVLHHIISDGWSRGLLWREISGGYAACARGDSAPPMALDVQVADYSAWQAQWIAQGGLDGQFEYWRQKLAVEPDPLNLPTDAPRRFGDSPRGERLAAPLDPALCAALKTLAEREGATFFMVLLTAFKALLNRYTGAEDLTVGVPIANRTRVEAEPLIGCFINTLVFRTSLVGDPEFREALRRVKETALGAYANQDAPFERLVEFLNVRRDASRTPLFQAMFALQDFAEIELRCPGVQTTRWPIPPITTMFELSVDVERFEGGWRTAIQYNTGIFDRSRIERMLGHWQTLLEAVAANPALRISEIPLLRDAERRQLLVDWNRTAADFPRDRDLHEIFEAQVEKSPDAVAVVFERLRLTYRELNRRANHLARRLREMGVGPDALVALCLERSLEMVVSVLAVLKAGGAYVPVDPDYPPGRVRLMLGDARPSALLATQKHAQLLADVPADRILFLDGLRGSDSPGDSVNVKCPAALHHLAYVIYTSGSTGTPKGVMIERGGILNHMQWIQADFPLAPGDALLQKSPFSFDASVWEFFAPLLAGARLVVARPGGHRDPAYIAEVMARENVTIVQLVPAQLAALVDEPGFRQCASLRRVFSGGEALSAELAEKFFKASRADLQNMYGPTEVTIVATCHPVRPGLDGPSVPIGRPIPNIQAYVLDPSLRPVPIGVAGGLFLGGAGVARGYLNRPELTAERFIANPFSNDPASRLYRTGDLARCRADGVIEFLGRADHQVKLRGFRIELGEIEAALMACPGVRDCAVVLHEAAAGGQRLVAYLAADKPPPGWRQSVGLKLPDYMVPSAIVTLDKLPLSPSGKVDRRALPAPEMGDSSGADSFQKPWLPLHHQLMALWERTLKVPCHGINENFFERGGHSLLAVRMLAGVEEICGKRLPASAMFSAQTVGELADLILKDSTAAHGEMIPLRKEGVGAAILHWHGDLQGGGYYARRLSGELENPFYVLPTFPPGAPPCADASTLARLHVEYLRGIGLRGPFILSGFCLSGWLALEMARQLADAGETIEKVILIDSAPLGAAPRWMQKSIALATRIRLLTPAGALAAFARGHRRLALARQWWRRHKSLPFPEFARAAARRLLSPAKPGQPNESTPPDGDDSLQGIGDPAIPLIWAVASCGFSTQGFPVDVIFSGQLEEARPDVPNLLEARPQLGNLHRIHGPHLGLVTDRVSELAEAFRRAR